MVSFWLFQVEQVKVKISVLLLCHRPPSRRFIISHAMFRDMWKGCAWFKKNRRLALYQAKYVQICCIWQSSTAQHISVPVVTIY